METTLVTLPKPKSSSYKAPPRLDTPFGRFWMLVANQASTEGWSGLPLNYIISDGLWAIMLGIAQRYGLSTESEHETWDVVAVIANRLINVGLLFTGPEKATSKFENEVLKPVRQELERQSGCEVTQGHKLWQEHSMRFFAQLFKLGRESIERLQRLYQRMRTQNSLSSHPEGPELIQGESHDGVSEIDRILSPFMVDQQPYWEKAEPDYNTLVNYEEERRKQLRLQKVLQELPAHLVIRGEKDVVRASYDKHLVRTHLLLAANDQPLERLQLHEAEYIPFLLGLKSLPQEERLNRFWRRMYALGYRPGDPPEELVTLVADTAALMDGWSTEPYKPKKNENDHRAYPDLFVDSDPTKMDIPLHGQEDLDMILLSPNLDMSMLKKFDWTSLSNDPLKKVLEGHAPDRILAALECLPDKRARQLAKHFASDPQLSPQFLMKGWISLEKAVINQPRDLTEQERKRYFLKILSYFKSAKVGIEDRERSISFFEIACTLRKGWVRAQLRAAKKRLNAINVLEAFLHGVRSMKADTEVGRLDDRLPYLLGPRFFLQLTLAMEAEWRWSIRSDMGHAGNQQMCLPAWMDIYDTISYDQENEEGVYHSPKDLSPFNEKKTKALMAKEFTEENILAWLWEANPTEANKRVKQLPQLNAQYYRIKHAQGHTVPPAYVPSSRKPTKTRR